MIKSPQSFGPNKYNFCTIVCRKKSCFLSRNLIAPPNAFETVNVHSTVQMRVRQNVCFTDIN